MPPTTSQSLRRRRGQRFFRNRGSLAVLAAAIVGSALALPTSPASAGIGDCTVTRSGSNNVITWEPSGETDVIRRDGGWLVTPEAGTSTFTDAGADASAQYLIRSRAGGITTDSTCASGGTGAEPSCAVVRSGSNNILSWIDGGGRHVVRMNGNWLATPGSGVSTYTHVGGPADADYIIRTLDGGTSTDEPCAFGDPVDPVDPGGSCLVTRSGDDNVISWVDDGGRHVIRRDGNWIATPGVGVSSYTDSNAVVGATYELRTFVTGTRIDQPCAAGEPVDPGVPDDRQFVVHISIDGLRSDFVNSAVTPNLQQLIAGGAATLNARTDPDETKTLPNHTSQLTGRFVGGPDGHGVTFNNDIPGETIHLTAGEYVASVFDVVHDNGGRTVFYTGKEKFLFLDRSWGIAGAPDVTGPDDGTDKIDVFVRDDPTETADAFVADLVAGGGDTFGFFHIREPDSAGHTYNWGSAGYEEGVRDADLTLGQLLDALDAAGVLSQTTIIVTVDHGGPTGENLHDAPADDDTYTVPFIVWGQGVQPGADLYGLNTTSRTDPGADQVNENGPQPIRGHDAGNLALDLLGLPAIPGSTVNAAQDLAVS